VRQRIEELLGAPVGQVRAVGASHGTRHLVATLADGREAFIKDTGGGQHAGELAAEAAGLRWLAEAGGVPVPEVIAHDENLLVTEMLPPGSPTSAAARAFGTGLARTHAAGSAGFGAPWPGYLAGLPLPNGSAEQAGAEWGEWYRDARLVPYIRIARDNGGLPSGDARLVEEVAARAGELGGPPEPPARIHGDLWAGNVLWSGGRGWLIDPAAHGGHRETDLAMLALFGAPYLDEILAAYDERAPLADGWRGRVPLHQLHPLLVHACLYGAAYAPRLREAARAALGA